MTADHSLGWEAVADRFMAVRSDIGTALVRSWARDALPASATILDIGCGSGLPIARALVDDGFAVSGIDASPSLIAAFRRNIPGAPAACEAVRDSALFSRTFAGAVSIGFVFLLDAIDQRKLLGRVATALEPDGRFLFSAPRDMCEWRDTLTGRPSMSLGENAYARHLDDVGLRLVRRHADEGGNHYYDAMKPGTD